MALAIECAYQRDDPVIYALRIAYLTLTAPVWLALLAGLLVGALVVDLLEERMRRTFYVVGPGIFYFRICGYGLAFQRDSRAYFSERMGFKKVLRIGRWAIQTLAASSLPSAKGTEVKP